MNASSPLADPLLTEQWAWFDVDDVLVESTPLFQESLDRWSGLHRPWQEWTHNRFHQFYGVADDDLDIIQELRDLWRKERILERSPLSPDAGPVLRELSDMGLRIGLITARAWHPEGREITEEMAEAHQLPVDRVIAMHYEETKAGLLVQSGTQVASFLDDTTRHAQACHDAGFNSALFRQPWNADAQGLRVIERLADVPRWVAESLAPRARPRPRR